MNCIIIDDEELSRQIIKQFIQKTDFLTLIGSFSDPIGALTFLSTAKVDLLFLDIEMPEMTGMELINTIKQQLPQVILITAHKEFALEAFEYNITDYLIKPVLYPRFYKAALKAKDLFDKQTAFYHSDNDTFFVKRDNSIIRIQKSEILWVEALGDYVTLNTGKEKFIVHSTMKDIEVKLPPKDYMRVHRSYIVRIDKIDSIEDHTISYNEKLIPIAKSYREEVFKRLNLL